MPVRGGHDHATRSLAIHTAATDLVAAAYRWSGLAGLVRWLTRNRVAILVYHDPAPAVLARHLAYLQRRYSIIPLDDLVEALHRRDLSRLPRRALVITFDDGHRGNRELLDVLRRHRVRPTVYLCSQIVATNRHYWWTVSAADRQELKRMPTERSEHALRERYAHTPTREYGDRQALSLAEVADMSPHVDFASHTRFHPILTRCDDARQVAEIAGSKHEIELLSSQPCRHFAYPNGDYSRREIETLRRAGYRSGRTCDAGWNGPGGDPYRLKVLGTDDVSSVSRLAADLAGLFWLKQRIRRRLRPASARGEWPAGGGDPGGQPRSETATLPV